MSRSYTGGILIIILGVILLLGKFGVFGFLGNLWPLFVLIPGLLFHFFFFARMLPSGVLIPGGILTVYALMFFYCNVFGWHAMGYLWPGFILGVAIGLYEFYLFSVDHPRGALLASLIVGGISVVFFGFTLLLAGGVYFIAVALIAVGLYLIYRRPRAW